MPTSPLAHPQRETSGSSTLSKYHYQYHWALQQALEAFAEKKEYALLVEYHEDVVLTNGIDPKNVKFDFYQIKNVESALSIADVLRGNGKSSMLEKLLAIRNRVQSVQISSICLVSANGFGKGFEEKNGLNLVKLNLNDLDRTKAADLFAAIELNGVDAEEFGRIHFAQASLPPSSFKRDIIGLISEAVEKLYPGAQCSATLIYRSLIDELFRLGTNSHDYKDWNELLKHKALVSNDLAQVVVGLTTLKNRRDSEELLDEILAELNLGVLAKRKLRRAAQRYSLERIGTRSSSQLDVSRYLERAVATAITVHGDNFSALLQDVRDGASEAMIRRAVSEDDFNGSILGELIHHILENERP